MRIGSPFLAMSLLLASSAWAVDLELTSSEERQLHASRPYFKHSLGKVTLEADNACLYCGNFSQSFYRSSKEEMLDQLFAARQLLKTQLRASGIFTEDSDSKLGLNVTVLSMVHDSSDGKNDKFSMTSGVTMTTQMKLNYELMDKNKVVASWQIATQATSNSVGSHDRIIESTDIALTRNIRVFILKLKMDYDPAESASARQALAELGGESDNTRSVLGYLLVGGAHVGKATVAATGAVLQGMADACRDNPSCVDGSSSDFYADINKIHNDTMRDIDQTVQKNREQQEAQRRADASAAAERREQESRRRTQENERARQAYANRSPAQPPQPSPYATGTAQPQQPSRQELQAQLAARQQAQNRYEEERQRQVNELARERAQRGRQPQQATTGDSDSPPAEAQSSKKKVKYGPEQPEGVAVCWQSKKNKDIWWCDGPIQFTELGEPLEKQLGYVGCNPYRDTDGNREITLKSGSTVTATVYLCGYGIWTDRDVTERYGITVQRNHYQCVNGPKWHCKENFQMTD